MIPCRVFAPMRGRWLGLSGRRERDAGPEEEHRAGKEALRAASESGLRRRHGHRGRVAAGVLTSAPHQHTPLEQGHELAREIVDRHFGEVTRVDCAHTLGVLAHPDADDVDARVGASE